MGANSGSRLGSTIAICVLLAVTSACGVSTDETVRSLEDVPAQADTTTTSSTELTEAAPQTDTTTTSLPTEQTEAPAMTTTVPGGMCVVRCPMAGTVLRVAGIAFDGQLELRIAPGADQAVVATLPPITDVVATGDNRLSWFEVTSNGATGWAPSLNLFGFNGTFDITPDIVSELGGKPRAASMLELGRIVAETRTATFDNMTSAIVAVVAPTEDAIGEVTYDVLGLPDDSVFGERLRITGRQVNDGDLPATGIARAIVFELSTVESTFICARSFGISGGLCA